MSNARIIQLPATVESFGLAIDFLSGVPPFSDQKLVAVCGAVRRQITETNHVAAVDGRRLVGYLGWLHTMAPAAEAWLEDRGELTATPVEKADAVALTLVDATSPSVLRLLIRAARDKNPSRRVYFKRNYADPERAMRKSSVFNRVDR